MNAGSSNMLGLYHLVARRPPAATSTCRTKHIPPVHLKAIGHLAWPNGAAVDKAMGGCQPIAIAQGQRVMMQITVALWHCVAIAICLCSFVIILDQICNFCCCR
jgi:hypothetical protein